MIILKFLKGHPTVLGQGMWVNLGKGLIYARGLDGDLLVPCRATRYFQFLVQLFPKATNILSLLCVVVYISTRPSGVWLNWEQSVQLV